MRRSQLTVSLAGTMVSLAQAALALTIVTLPWRQRIVLAERPFPPIYPDFTNLLLYTHQLFLLALLLLWAASLVLHPRRLHTGPSFLWWPMLGLTALTLLSAVTAIDRLLAGAQAAQLLLLLFLYLFVVNEVKGLGLAAAVVSLQILIQAVVSIGQGWQQRSLGLAWLGERVLDPWNGASFVWAQGALRSLRAYGLSDHPNILAAGLTFSLLLLTAWILSTKSRWTLPAVAIFGLGCVALFLTFSRPAWTAFVVGAVGTAVFFAQIPSSRRRWWLPQAGAAVLLLLPFIWLRLPFLQFGTDPGVIASRLQERINWQQERSALILAANEQFSGHALTGVGPGSLPLALKTGAHFDFDYQPAPVSLITAAAEIGLIGALFYLFTLAAPWLALAIRPRRIEANPALAGVYGLLLAIIVFSFLDAYPWFHPAGRSWQWLAWSLWAVEVKKEK